jgi:hypothetical protein
MGIIDPIDEHILPTLLNIIVFIAFSITPLLGHESIVKACA